MAQTTKAPGSSGLTILGAGGASDDSGPLIVGIDLGTTYSLVASMTADGPALVRDQSGDARVPSVIGFAPDGKVEVGFAARRHALSDPRHTVYSIKRLIGKTMADLASDLDYVPYQVIERETSDGRKVLCVRIDDREQTPEELSALILREVADRATAKLGRKVEKAVITVPAYFDETQRQATRDAGRIAGLDVVRIVNEPTAAALAYGLGERTSGRIAVYDFGGGTFDCSILQLDDGVFRVLSTHGDTRLGGDDLDCALMALVLPEGAGDPAAQNPHIVQAVRDGCERAKIELSTAESTTIDVDLPERQFRRQVALTRAQFEATIRPFVDRTIQSCKAALRDAGVQPSEIDEVVLVGGSSRIPLVQRQVEELFGRRPHCELNPDEVVAMGAAVQASILSGKMRRLLLLDITPLSLGIETMGGAVSRLIPRNSTIPAQATERFTTFVDNQTGVDIHVVQGERELVKDCRSLGRFKLSGVPPMPAGMPRIDVTFLIDANGMLQVTAKEERSGSQAGIEVQPSHGLSRDEVDAMIRQSIEKARDDFEARKLVDLRTKAEANLRHTEKAMCEGGEQLDASQRQEIESSRARLERAMKSDDVKTLQAAVDHFDAATLPLAELLMNRVARAELVNKRIDED